MNKNINAGMALTNRKADMNAVEEKPKEIVTRWRPMREVQPLAKPTPAPPKPAAAPATANSAPASLISADFDLRTLSKDENSSHLVNFPFALTAFLVLGLGLLLMGWAMIVVSIWISVSSFVLTLIGGALYGWSLYVE